MEPELEKLLEQTEFNHLSLNEKQMVLAHMTKEEYKQLSVFLDLSRKSFEDDYKKMNPDSGIMPRLKFAYRQAFQVKTPSIWAYSTVAALVVLGIVLLFVFNYRGDTDFRSVTTAMDTQQIENFELLRAQMSLKETCMYSKIIVPETDMMMFISPDTLLIPQVSSLD